MDKKLVMHIGLRKAGSSTVQQFLNVNAEQLKAIGCDYPRIGRRARWSHLNIAAEARKLEQFDSTYGGVREMRDYVDRQNFPITIISSEAFEPTPRESVELLNQVLFPAFSQTKILLVIREPQRLIPSSFAEGVLSGRQTVDFDAFFTHLISTRRLRYHLTAKRWALVLGWEAVLVRLLDRDHLVNGDLTDDFMTTVGVDIEQPAYKALVRPNAANVSPGWRVIEALRALYSGGHGLPPSHPLVKAPRNVDNIRSIRSNAEILGAKLGWNSDRGSYITPAQAERCEAIFVDAVSELNQRLSAKLPSPAYPSDAARPEREFLPDASLIKASELRDFYDILGDMFGLSSDVGAEELGQWGDSD